MKLWLSRRQLLNFDVFPLHSAGPPCSQCLEARFLGCESCRVMNPGIGAVGTVGNFLFRIYSVDEALPEFRNGFADAFILDNIDPDADNHGLMLQPKRVSQ